MLPFICTLQYKHRGEMLVIRCCSINTATNEDKNKHYFLELA